MATKARPSSVYSQPAASDHRILSIGSKASAPGSAPSRLRSPPRPPVAVGGRGIIDELPPPTAPPARKPSAKVVAPTDTLLGWHGQSGSGHNGSVDRPVPTSRQAPAAPLPKYAPAARPAMGKVSEAQDGDEGWYDPEVLPSHGEDENGEPGGGGEPRGEPYGDADAEEEEQAPEWGQDEHEQAPEQQGEQQWEEGAEEEQEEQGEQEGEALEEEPPEFQEQIGDDEEPMAADEADGDAGFDAPLGEEEYAAEFQEEEEEPPEDEQGGDFDPDLEDKVPCREGDLSVDDIPEDQRDSMAGNLELKRALSQDLSNIPPEKRRRLDSGDFQPMSTSATAKKLLKQWRLERDSAASFVLRVADAKHVEALAKTRWEPNPAHKRSKAEQLYDQLTRLYERQGPPGGPLDAVAAFGHRWRLSASDDDLLAKLDHRRLRHVFREYDKTRPLLEVLEAASDVATFDDGDLAVPDKPGLFVLGRSQCLELIDPFGDALVLGDANLTFSLQLAEHRKSLSHSGRTVATTFEKLETLQERYAEIKDTLKQLEDLGAEVLHNVDCTRLAVDPRFQSMQDKFGAVYYNFPHAGVVPGFFDGHPFVRWRHANLMHLFFRALRHFVKPGGCVKVASNSGATGVRFSDIIGGARASEFMHDETFPFLEWQLARYRRSYGDRRDATKRPEDGEVYNAQRAHTDMVYCFTYRPSGKALPAPAISYPPTREELLASNEGRAGRLPGHGEQRRNRVEELLQLFLSYIQGIHIG